MVDYDWILHCQYNLITLRKFEKISVKNFAMRKEICKFPVLREFIFVDLFDTTGCLQSLENWKTMGSQRISLRPGKSGKIKKKNYIPEIFVDIKKKHSVFINSRWLCVLNANACREPIK